MGHACPKSLLTIYLKFNFNRPSFCWLVFSFLNRDQAKFPRILSVLPCAPFCLHPEERQERVTVPVPWLREINTQEGKCACISAAFFEEGKHRGKTGMDWEFGIRSCKLLHVGWISNKILLYITGN